MAGRAVRDQEYSFFMGKYEEKTMKTPLSYRLLLSPVQLVTHASVRAASATAIGL